MNTTMPTVIPLWPDGAPGSESWSQVETEGILILLYLTLTHILCYASVK